MKNSLIILSVIALFFLFSCVNPQKPNQIESKKKDSIYWAGKEAKAFIHADSIFTGFMDLKWNSSKKEAVKFLKTSKDLKLSFITNDGGSLYFKGSFAGSKINSSSMSFYKDKLYDVWIDFGIKSEVFEQALVEKLELKYGNAYKSDKFYTWDFGVSFSETNKPQILISKDKDGLALMYISKYKKQYEAEKAQIENSKEKNSIKLKDL